MENTLSRSDLKKVIYGSIFISGEQGLDLFDLRRVTSLNFEDIKQVIEELKTDMLNSDYNPLSILEYAGNRYKLITKPDHNNYYSRIIAVKTKSPLTQAIYENLAIIAYNQPCTRRKIDDIRGTNNSIHIDNLVTKGLIREVGRESTPGNPILYEVTEKFFDLFGLKSLSDLPEIILDEKFEEKSANIFDNNFE
jgi:segregation and condensation protein B